MISQRLSIRQTYAQIGIQTEWGTLDIASPRGELSIEQHSGDLRIESPAGELKIDSSEACMALGKGPHFEWSNMIYSQDKNIALQAIAKTVEDGNRMAQITNPRNAFAELAEDVFERTNPVVYVGEPSYFNVKMEYQPHRPEIDYTPKPANITYVPVKPEIQYHAGSVDIYLRQKNSIDIQVTQYDLYQ